MPDNVDVLDFTRPPSDDSDVIDVDVKRLLESAVDGEGAIFDAEVNAQLAKDDDVDDKSDRNYFEAASKPNIEVTLY